MQTSETSNQSETRLNGDNKPQTQNYLQIIMKGPEVKDAEFRDTAECLEPKGDVVMVAYLAEDTSAEVRDEVILNMGIALRDRERLERSSHKNK